MKSNKLFYLKTTSSEKYGSSTDVKSNILNKDDEIVGEFNYFIMPDKKKVDIVSVEINKKHRNKGVLRDTISQFMCSIEKEGIESIELEPVGKIARQIWSKLGFVPSKRSDRILYQKIQCTR